jgi:hypothetical protein
MCSKHTQIFPMRKRASHRRCKKDVLKTSRGGLLTDFATTTVGEGVDESVGGARVFREKEKRGSSARVSRRNRWLNRAVKQLASSARGMGTERSEGENRGKG